MSEETIEVGGREWTLDEAEAVIAFVDGGGLGAIPEPLQSNGMGGVKIGLEHKMWTTLTCDYVRALRDFAFPWVEVARSEVRQGDRVRTTPLVGVVISSLSGLVCDIRDGSTWTLGSSVQIRRPRKRTVTAESLEPGVGMTFDVGDRVVLRDFYCMQRMVVWEVIHYVDTEDHVSVFWLDSVGAPHRDIFPASFLKKEDLNE